jgi:UDP-N-acetylmuramate--alanine ligase
MFSRTKRLFDEFAKAVGLADAVTFLPIYAAREENESGVTSRELSVKALEYTSESKYYDSFDKAITALKKVLSSEDVVVVMGAGDVTDLAAALVK